MVSKILLGSEEALWPKKLEISHASQILTHEPQILVLSYLITTVQASMYWYKKGSSRCILMRGCGFNFNYAKMQNTEAKRKHKIAGTE